MFKSRLLSFLRSNQSNIFNIFDPIVLELLTCLHLGLSHLNEHKFHDIFQDCLNPACSSSLEIEDTTHYLLHGQHFSNHCYCLMNRVKALIPNFEFFANNNRIDILLYSPFDENKNEVILKATIKYLKSSKSFSGSLLKQNFYYVVICPFKPIIL